MGFQLAYEQAIFFVKVMWNHAMVIRSLQK